jgi:S1-C subfamily serine protease
VNLVDWVLVGAIVVFALAGWQRGFVAGLLSFVGFLGGGLAAVFILPRLLEAIGVSEVVRSLAVVAGVLVCAVGGQLLASMLGNVLHGGITWRPARFVDNLGGAALNVMVLAVVTWIVASALAYLPVSTVSKQVSQSRVLTALDAIVPAQARDAFDNLSDLVGTTDVPRIFSGFSHLTGPDVAAPDPEAVTELVKGERDSIVRVDGATPECGGRVDGSGFFVTRDRVITNAHVVAGVDSPVVFVGDGTQSLAATVVYFDPAKDIAVLAVSDATSRPLKLTDQLAEPGDDAVVAGYPLAGPFRQDPARVRTSLTARGDDIYGAAGVDREVYVLRGTVQPGNSGGPLLRPDGLVLGMVFGADLTDEQVGYAMTSQELRPAIAAGKSATASVDTGTCRIVD